MTIKKFFIALILGLFIFEGCQSKHEVDVKPVEIKPIHITIDLNIKIDKELDDFFSDLDEEAAETPADE